MLFQHKHLLDELRNKGRKAQGEILSITTLGSAAGLKGTFAPDEDLTRVWYECRMVLRVVPEDRAEPPFEAHVLTRIHTEKFPGAHVPVWYDPADRARVVVDYEEDLARITTATVEARRLRGISDRATHRTEQRIGVAWTPVDDALVPIEVIPRPGRGRVQVTDWPVPCVHQGAEEAVDFVRAHADALLPPRDGGWDRWFAGHDLRVFQSYGPVPAAEGAADASSVRIGVALALLSALTGHLVRYEVSVAGVLAPSGELLPVASLPHVARAARQAFAQRLVASVGNERELGAVPAKVRQNLEIVFAGSLREAMRLSLAKHAAKGFRPPD
jgi:Lon protease (S16) C-terminal proteolytic domain